MGRLSLVQFRFKKGLIFMKILSIDASQKQIYIGYGEENCFYPLLNTQLEKAEQLPLVLKQSLLEAEMKVETFHRVAITTGPGNYTSLRAGILLVKSLAMVHPLQIFAKNRLEVMLYLMRQHGPALVSQNVRQGQFYTAVGHYTETGIHYRYPPTTLKETEVENLWKKQSWPTYGDWPAPPQPEQGLELLAALTAWAHVDETCTSPEALVPFYIRPPVVTAPSATP